MSTPPRSKPGDIWLLENHRLMCGNARSPGDLDRLMAGAVADMLRQQTRRTTCKSQAWSVEARSNIPEFAEASGEQSPEQFIAFLTQTLGNATRVSRPGALHYVFMDWRHVGELLEPDARFIPNISAPRSGSRQTQAREASTGRNTNRC